MLTEQEAHDWAVRLLERHRGERGTLDLVHLYWTGRQAPPLVPTGVPRDVWRLANMSRVNLIEPIIDVTAQALYVDGYRANPAVSEEDAPGWSIWQANKMDAHQTGVHRDALAFGTSYVIVLPGEPLPVLRGVSPRSLVAMYDESSGDWPYYALEAVSSPWDPTEYRLYDEDAVYTFSEDDGEVAGEPEDIQAHGLGVCPVIRFRNRDTLNEPPPDPQPWFSYTEAPTGGEIEPLMPLQDQVDVTKFDLLVAQHFQSFRQRYILGWTADEEDVRAKANAGRLWTFEDPEVKVGEFGQVDLSGYLNSLESTVTHLGVLSQTPSHELLGKMANLSAEALVAAEVGQRRKVTERQNLFGESWEQMFGLASQAAGFQTSEAAQVRWRDTEARSLSQTIDALGKLATMLQVPPEMLWERVPGITQQDVARWMSERSASALLAAATLPEAPAPTVPPEAAPASEGVTASGGG